MTMHVPARILTLAALSLSALAAAGCSAATSPTTSPAAARAGGSGQATQAGSPQAGSIEQASTGAGPVHLTAYTPDDGPTQTVIVTGAIGDYGQAVSVHPDGSVDPDHTGQLSLRLSHGSFRLDIAQLDKEFISEMAHQFPTSKATCSGSLAVTRKVPVVPGSGSGRYRNVSGSFTLTLTLDEVDKADPAKPCDGTAAFLSQAIVITGPGTVAF